MSRQSRGMDIFLRTGKSHRQPISEFQNASNTLKASENLLGISPAWKIQVTPPLWSIANKKCSFTQSQFFSLNRVCQKEETTKKYHDQGENALSKGTSLYFVAFETFDQKDEKAKVVRQIEGQF